MRRRILSAALILGLVGCDASRPYTGEAEKNVRIRTSAGSGRIALDVFSLNSGCEATYLGYVALDRPLVEVGLPAGRASLLVFQFEGTTSIKKEVQLVPLAGNRYEAYAAYKDSIYDIELREIDPRTGANRELDGRRRC